MKNKRLFFIFSFSLLVSAGFVQAQEAEGILTQALKPTRIGYAGHMSIVHWAGKEAHAEEVDVYYRPPNRYRMEYLNPAGEIERIVVSDGDEEQILIPKRKQILSGDTMKNSSRLLSTDKEWRLLMNNYTVSSLGEDSVSGRPVWVVKLVPKVRGKPQQKISIDKETNVILEIKRFRPQALLAVDSRFTKFNPGHTPDENLFLLTEESHIYETEHALDSDYMTFQELEKATGAMRHFPEVLPDGFVFESANYFQINGATVKHFRYTDGLTVISLFQTSKPVQLHNKSLRELERNKPTPQSLQLADSNEFLKWQKNQFHYMMIGDVSDELMRNISVGFK